jgi:hypothetical protein
VYPHLRNRPRPHTQSEKFIVGAYRTPTGDEWILYSATSFHICINRDWFITYDFVQGGSIRIGDDSSHQIICIGSVQIKMHDGIIRT